MVIVIILIIIINNNNDNNNKITITIIVIIVVAKLWRMRKVWIMTVGIGALGMVTKDFRKFVERLEVPAKVEVIQKFAL